MGVLGYWYFFFLLLPVVFLCVVLFWLLICLAWFGLGDAQIGTNVTALDPTSVASEVWYGKESGKYSSKKRGNATVYSQLYPFEGLFNYTSAIIHHVRIDGIV